MKGGAAVPGGVATATARQPWHTISETSPGARPHVLESSYEAPYPMGALRSVQGDLDWATADVSSAEESQTDVSYSDAPTSDDENDERYHEHRSGRGRGKYEGSCGLADSAASAGRPHHVVSPNQADGAAERPQATDPKLVSIIGEPTESMEVTGSSPRTPPTAGPVIRLSSTSSVNSNKCKDPLLEFLGGSQEQADTRPAANEEGATGGDAKPEKGVQAGGGIVAGISDESFEGPHPPLEAPQLVSAFSGNSTSSEEEEDSGAEGEGGVGDKSSAHHGSGDFTTEYGSGAQVVDRGVELSSISEGEHEAGEEESSSSSAIMMSPRSDKEEGCIPSPGPAPPPVDDTIASKLLYAGSTFSPADSSRMANARRAEYGRSSRFSRQDSLLTGSGQQPASEFYYPDCLERREYFGASSFCFLTQLFLDYIKSVTSHLKPTDYFLPVCFCIPFLGRSNDRNDLWSASQLRISVPPQSEQATPDRLNLSPPHPRTWHTINLHLLCQDPVSLDLIFAGYILLSDLNVTSAPEIQQRLPMYFYLARGDVEDALSLRAFHDRPEEKAWYEISYHEILGGAKRHSYGSDVLLIRDGNVEVSTVEALLITGVSIAIPAHLTKVLVETQCTPYIIHWDETTGLWAWKRLGLRYDGCYSAVLPPVKRTYFVIELRFGEPGIYRPLTAVEHIHSVYVKAGPHMQNFYTWISDDYDVVFDLPAERPAIRWHSVLYNSSIPGTLIRKPHVNPQVQPLNK